jgi:FkbM family methyltransferase
MNRPVSSFPLATPCNLIYIYICVCVCVCILTRELEIYLFEANPHFNTDLIHAKEKYDAQDIKINLFPATVVDTIDGTRTFYLDTVNTAHDYWGSSTNPSHPDAVKSGGKGTDLTAINISRWLMMNFLPRDFVVVKMDIEGSEYDVIPMMAQLKAWLVIDHLLVEWHTGLANQTAVDRVNLAVEQMRAGGTNMPSYNSAA